MEKSATKTSFAVIETGGKQYRVSPGDRLKIEKIPDLKDGDKVVFDKILLVSNDGDAVFGNPYIAGAKVEAVLVRNGRAKKIDVIHYKQKSRYFKKYGHRQQFVEVKIESLK